MQMLFIIPPNISHEAYVEDAVNVSGRSIPGKDGAMHRVVDIQTDIPLGFLSIAAYCRDRLPGAEFELLDFNAILGSLERLDFSSFEELFGTVLEKRFHERGIPEFIGISALFSPLFSNVVLLAGTCKRIAPSIRVVVGGGLATNQYRQLFRATDNVDACCFGEGEIPILELLQSADPERLFRESPSWITPETVDSKTPVNRIVENLDDIPALEFPLCSLGAYSANSNAAHFAKSLPGGDGGETGVHLHVMTSRGCPHKCSFCSAHSVHGRPMRYQSIERVKEDFALYARLYRPSCLVLQDDNFSADRKRAYAILDILKSLSLQFVFTSGLVMANLDLEFLMKLRECGLKQIILPIESGSDRVLRELMHKPLNRKIISRVVADCRRAGITALANVIFGYPGETVAEMDDAVRFLKTLDVDWFYLYVASPLPGSEMYETCVEKGYIREELLLAGTYKKPIITTPDFTPEFISEKVYGINLELNFISNTAMRRKEYKSALQQFAKVFKAKPDHALCHFLSGVCLERLGRKEEAEKHFSECRTILEKDDVQIRYFTRFLPQLRETIGPGEGGNLLTSLVASNVGE